jgi:hypothetical protein
LVLTRKALPDPPPRKNACPSTKIPIHLSY